jgi:hypothetical protein
MASLHTEGSLSCVYYEATVARRLNHSSHQSWRVLVDVDGRTSEKLSSDVVALVTSSGNSTADLRVDDDVVCRHIHTHRTSRLGVTTQFPSARPSGATGSRTHRARGTFVAKSLELGSTGPASCTTSSMKTVKLSSRCARTTFGHSQAFPTRARSICRCVRNGGDCRRVRPSRDRRSATLGRRRGHRRFRRQSLAAVPGDSGGTESHPKRLRALGKSWSRRVCRARETTSCIPSSTPTATEKRE